MTSRKMQLSLEFEYGLNHNRGLEIVTWICSTLNKNEYVLAHKKQQYAGMVITQPKMSNMNTQQNYSTTRQP